MGYLNITEEEIKNKVAQDYFAKYDCTRILGKIDFAVKVKSKEPAAIDEYLLWAEAKPRPTDVYVMLAQLVLTIGKARTFDEIMPPSFLGCYDSEKIAFIPYNEVQDIFYMNDFNWNVAPSNHDTREFSLVYERIKHIAEGSLPFQTCLFYFGRDDSELRRFIRDNFRISVVNDNVSRLRIDKNNFVPLYNKWLQSVKPTISVNWDAAKRNGVIDGDFYLADLLAASTDGKNYKTLKDSLYAVLHSTYYEMNRHIDEMGFFTSGKVEFNDGQRAHNAFWSRYKRPPREEYWDFIIARRDLLVPQDVRERKGSYFTPSIWVETSQRYIAETFGENWQEEYYVWDCCAGTGNLLAGLINKYNIWASTLDKQDVDVMQERILNGANLLPTHVFRFDFLNDDFSKLPQPLQNIINDPVQRKKLIIYMNPPYAEIAGNKIGVNLNKVHDRYHNQLAGANRELFAQFLIRIYNEIPDCIIAEFSKLKTLSGAHFETFRQSFKAKLLKMFIMPAWSFDNVSGKFPIGFKIWDTAVKEEFIEIMSDVYGEKHKRLNNKGFYSYKGYNYFSAWVNAFKKRDGFPLGWLEGVTRNDFQAQKGIYITNSREQVAVPRGIEIYDKNLIECCICFAVRKVIPASWLNDRDQFLYPKDGWQRDEEFHNDCLAYTLFSNNISARQGVNRWIPFAEYGCQSMEKFDSNFMYDFIKGNEMPVAHESVYEFLRSPDGKYFGEVSARPDLNVGKARVFSSEARTAFYAGQVLWRYYHNVLTERHTRSAAPYTPHEINASLYDIREYFQGRNAKGVMNARSDDERYNELIGTLRDALTALAAKITPKVYEYEFLLR